MSSISKVSVCLITYNHVKYISQAVDSVLLQQTNFDWELIIADDFSIDGTRDIIHDYSDKYSDRIRLLLQKENVGPAKNWLDLISSARGEFIAYFEGDDYWVDPNKLQKQIDFLENHKDFVAHSHNAWVLQNNNFVKKYNGYEVALVMTKEDLLTSLAVPSG